MIFKRKEITIRLSKYKTTKAYKISVEDNKTGIWLESAKYYEKGKLSKAIDYIKNLKGAFQ